MRDLILNLIFEKTYFLAMNNKERFFIKSVQLDLKCEKLYLKCKE